MSIVSCKPTITRKELESVLDCLISEKLESGDVIKGFESQVSALTGVKYAITTNSLTSAYHLAFLALDLKASDEVIMPSYFDPAPLNALRLTGAKPVLVDIDDNSFTPSAAQIREKITPATRALVTGHTFGFYAPMADYKALEIPIIEDISHVIGAEHEEKSPGQDGVITLASFAPSMMITTGNGGIVLTSNSRFFSTMRDLRGTTDATASFDYTMTDFQGAMGLSQLSRLQDFIRRRREIARLYHEALKNTTHRTMYAFSDAFVYQAFPIQFDASMEKVDKFWKKSGIEVVHPIGKPLHAHLQLRGMDFPNSDRMSKKMYSLPVYPTLSKKEIEKISKTIAKFV
jgi:perosamine synthetase